MSWAYILTLDRDQDVASQAGASAANLRLALSPAECQCAYVGAGTAWVKFDPHRLIASYSGKRDLYPIITESSLAAGDGETLQALAGPKARCRPMADSIDRPEGGAREVRNGIEKRRAIAQASAASAIQRWVNEGGSLSPGEKMSARARAPAQSSFKEARNTVAGCRDLAAQDHLRAAAASTENGRNVFERSAASWESRADEIQNGQDRSTAQRAIDRALWASEEREDDGATSISRALGLGTATSAKYHGP